MSTSSSTKRTPTVPELAWLFDILDDQPDRYKSIVSDQAAMEELVLVVRTFTDRIRPTLAEFLSLYLPSALKIFQECSHVPPLVESVLRIFYWTARTPQFRVGIHRLEEGTNLPSLLARRFVSYPPQLLLSTEPDEFFAPFADLVLLKVVIESALDFGQGSHCNFRLSPPLLVDLSRVGNAFLACPTVRDASLAVSATFFPSALRIALQSVLTSFDLGKYVQKNDRSAIFQCGQGVETEEKLWCGEEDCHEVDGLKFVRGAPSSPTAPSLIKSPPGRNTNSSASNRDGRATSSTQHDASRSARRRRRILSGLFRVWIEWA